MSDPILVTVSDMKALDYCKKGCRKFYLEHGLNWRECMREGTPIEVLEAFDDPLAVALVQSVRARIAAETAGRE